MFELIIAQHLEQTIQILSNCHAISANAGESTFNNWHFYPYLDIIKLIVSEDYT